MAGLLDFLMQPAGSNNIFGGFFPEQHLRDIRPRADTPLFDIAGKSTPEGFQIQTGRPGSLTGNTFSDRFGTFQPPSEPAAQAPAPQMMQPQQAAQAFDMPTGSYQFGGQMVPTYGQPEAPPEISAQRRGTGTVSGLQINPQGNPVSPAAVAPDSTSTGQDRWMEFLDRFSPDYVSRYRQTKQQQKVAQNLATFFQGPGMGMNPQQAASLATVAVSNPKVMEEILKPHPNMEAALASQYSGGGAAGGDKMTRYMDFIGRKKATETGAEVAGKTAAEAQIALPGGKADIEQSMQVIRELRNHAGRNSWGWHGPSANVPPEWLRGSKAFAAIKLEDQLKARTFTDQVKTMVGMGALSNAEGSKITDAVARIDRGLPKAEYDAALDFIETTLKNGIDKMSQKAGQPAPFGFKGNDGWTTAPNGARIRQR